VRKLRGVSLILSVFVLGLIVSGCGTEPDIGSPDKVIVYQNGKTTELEKNDGVYHQAVNITLDRFQDPVDVAKLAVLDEDISNMKSGEAVLEFIYLSPQTTTFNLSGFSTKKQQYSRLLFPLTGNYQDLMFLGDDTTYFAGPMGSLSSSEDLIKLLSK